MFGPSRRELLRLIERERNQHREELRQLLDRIMYLAGNPWSPPPQPLWSPEPESEPVEELSWPELEPID